MQNLVFADSDAGMTPLMVLIAIITADETEGAIGVDAHLVDKGNA